MLTSTCIAYNHKNQQCIYLKTELNTYKTKQIHCWFWLANTYLSRSKCFADLELKTIEIKEEWTTQRHRLQWAILYPVSNVYKLKLCYVCNVCKLEICHACIVRKLEVCHVCHVCIVCKLKEYHVIMSMLFVSEQYAISVLF
jgi:hypothetical protein